MIKTPIEFNNKYKDYLETGHYGLNIWNEEVVQYLDGVFPVLIQLKDFKFSQIKTKWNWVEFYSSLPYGHPTIERIKKDIQEILKQYDKNGNKLSERKVI